MPASVTKRKYSEQKTNKTPKACNQNQMKTNKKPPHIYLLVLQRFRTFHYLQAQHINFDYISTCTPIPNKTSACANILVLLDFFGCLLLSIQLYQISASKQIYFMLSQ